MAELPRYERSTTVSPQGLSDMKIGVVSQGKRAQGRFLQEIGETAHYVNRAIEPEIRRAREEQAERDVSKLVFARDENGQPVLPETPEGGNFYQDKYNRAMEGRYLNEIDGDIQIKANELASENRMDPEGFRTAWEGYIRGLQGSVDERVAGAVVDRASTVGAQHVAHISDQKQQFDLQEAMDLGQQAYQNALDDMENMVLQGGAGTPDAQAAIGRAEAQIQQLRDSNLINDADVETMRTGIAVRTESAGLWTQVRNMGPVAALSAVNQYVESGAGSSLNMEQREAVRERLSGYIYNKIQLQSQARSEAAYQDTLARNQMYDQWYQASRDGTFSPQMAQDWLESRRQSPNGISMSDIQLVEQFSGAFKNQAMARVRAQQALNYVNIIEQARETGDYGDLRSMHANGDIATDDYLRLSGDAIQATLKAQEGDDVRWRAALEVAIDQGTVPENELIEMANDPESPLHRNPEWLTGLRSRAESAGSSLALEGYTASVNRALAVPGTMLPTPPEGVPQTALAGITNRLYNEAQAAGPEAAMDMAVRQASAGVVTGALKSQLEAARYTTDPATAIEAADLWANMVRASPQIITEIDAGTHDLLTRVNDMAGNIDADSLKSIQTLSGASSNRVEQQRIDYYNENPEEFRDMVSDALAPQGSFLATLAAGALFPGRELRMGGGPVSAEVAGMALETPEFLREVQRVVEPLLPLYANEADAFKAATAQVASHWGVTELYGPEAQFVKNPPVLPAGATERDLVIGARMAMMDAQEEQGTLNNWDISEMAFGEDIFLRPVTRGNQVVGYNIMINDPHTGRIVNFDRNRTWVPDQQSIEHFVAAGDAGYLTAARPDMNWASRALTAAAVEANHMMARRNNLERGTISRAFNGDYIATLRQQRANIQAYIASGGRSPYLEAEEVGGGMSVITEEIGEFFGARSADD